MRLHQCATVYPQQSYRSIEKRAVRLVVRGSAQENKCWTRFGLGAVCERRTADVHGPAWRGNEKSEGSD